MYRHRAHGFEYNILRVFFKFKYLQVTTYKNLNLNERTGVEHYWWTTLYTIICNYPYQYYLMRWWYNWNVLKTKKFCFWYFIIFDIVIYHIVSYFAYVLGKDVLKTSWSYKIPKVSRFSLDFDFHRIRVNKFWYSMSHENSLG